MAQPLQQCCRAALSRYTLSHYVFQALEGVSQENRATPPPLPKGPVAPALSALKGCRTSSCLLKGGAVQGGCPSDTVACGATVGQLGTNVASGLVPSTVFLDLFWGIPGGLCRTFPIATNREIRIFRSQAFVFLCTFDRASDVFIRNASQVQSQFSASKPLKTLIDTLIATPSSEIDRTWGRKAQTEIDRPSVRGKPRSGSPNLGLLERGRGVTERGGNGSRKQAEYGFGEYGFKHRTQ